MFFHQFLLPDKQRKFRCDSGYCPATVIPRLAIDRRGLVRSIVYPGEYFRREGKSRDVFYNANLTPTKVGVFYFI
ncbi:MAG: hypothetical protein AUJ85_00925 [Elusimicrobia bacterium CG1_02_37_114]|nr:MAG: hypothetical protein AUJ85_00925 [Elusimicrobia bacterium CG1_02_37_114]